MYQNQTLPGRHVALTILLALFAYSNLTAQSLELDGTRSRQPATLNAGSNSLQVCGLQAGRSYLLTVNGLDDSQAIEWLDAGSHEAARLGAATARDLHFRATAPCVTLALNLRARTGGTVWISVSPTEPDPKPAPPAESAAALAVTANPGDAAALVAAIFGGSNTGCYQITNAVRTGNAQAFGSFTGGSTNVGLFDGLVLATGPADILNGANTQSNANGGFANNSADDPNLDMLATGNQYDLAILEFDIVAVTPTISFQFVFGSEEYCEWSTSSYNDVFGLFISGPGIAGTQNLARVPVTNEAVSVNSVNQFSNSSYFVNNVWPCSGLPQQAPNETQLDGWTKVLNASATVTPGATYHFKIAIADINDSEWLSAVFIRGQAGPSTTVNAGVTPPSINEGCQPTELRFARTNNDDSQPLVIDFSVSGTATPGVDYAALSSPVVIPAGQNEVIIPITAFADLDAEGPETVVFTVPNACAPDFSLTINDVDSLTVSVASQAGCINTVFGLGAVVAGGVAPYSYAWSDSSTLGTVLVTTAGVHTYTVTVTDACGETATASATATVYSEVAIDTAVATCGGAPVVLFGETFPGAGVFERTWPGANGQCDTTVTITIGVLPAIAVADTLALCPGDSVLIGGTLYGAPGTATDTLPGSTGQCDTIVTTTLVLRAANTATDTLALCPGDSILIGGTLYGAPGTATYTLPGSTGQCDTIVTTTLVLRAANTATDTLALCPGDSVLIGGTLYGAPGTATYTLPGSTGQCDTIVTTTLVLRAANTATDTLALCPGDSVLIGGTLYGAPGTATETLAGTAGQCDTVRTVVLTLLPPVQATETRTLCPGDSIEIGGAWYTAPATVVDTVGGVAGQCDTLRTYVLELQPAVASEVKLTCPGAVTQSVDPGVIGAVIVYDAPSGYSTDCPCPGLTVTQTSGLPSGAAFPLGTTTNCFVATDACGNSGTCCTTVTIEEDGPCDVQTNSCIKWEILDITKLPDNTKRYRMRVTNYCTPPLINAIFQLPNGMTAVSPANGSTYTAPSGRTYTVKNPNWSTFYSIRFNATQPGIANGQSDIFEYRLPPQANNVLFVRAQVRLSQATYLQMTLNTFYCEQDVQNQSVVPGPGTESDPVAADRGPGNDAIVLYPNPATDVLLVDAPETGALPVRVLDARGAAVLRTVLPATDGPRTLELPGGLRNGVYLLELRRADGRIELLRFTVVR